MKNSHNHKSYWLSDLPQNDAHTVRLNDGWNIQDLNDLRDRVSELRQELEKAEGDDKFDILTSLVECDLMQKKIIHIMLDNLIPELHRVHHQGSDIASEMEEAGHPFCDQFNESLTGYVLNRAQLERSMHEL